MLAQIADVCRWYADGPPSGRREAAALAELAHIADGRTDLLALHAGQVLARHDTGASVMANERVVQLRITAGADVSPIDPWSHESSRHDASRKD